MNDGPRFLPMIMLALIIAHPGCGIVQSVVKESSKKTKEEERAEVDKAAEGKDLEALARYCDRSVRMDAEAKKVACEHYIAILGERSRWDQLRKICDREIDAYYNRSTRNLACPLVAQAEVAVFEQEAADCSKILSAFEAAEKKVDVQAKEKLFFLAAKHLAKCEDWELYFTKFVNKDEADRGYRVLQESAEGGTNVRKAILAHLEAKKSDPFNYFDGETASKNVVKWLINAEAVGNCAEFIPYAQATTNSFVKESWIKLFGRSGCKEAADTVASYLSSGAGETRRDACLTLGAIGNKKHIAKMKPLAKSDPAYKMHGLVRIYYVRDTCKEAINKLSLQ